jgi:hypothetical protein
MRVALVCIAKNEDNYIEEWLNYYFKLGFDDIFIYQNDWRCHVEMDNLHKILADGDEIQYTAYNHFIQNYYDKYDWVAFFDVDEFLVLKKHPNIKNFINDYRDYLAIGINWVLFGDNGLSFDGNYSVLKRFTKRQSDVNIHVKCIVKLDKRAIMGIHGPVNTAIVNTEYKLFMGPFNENGKDDVAQLNHYFTKTWQEWQHKKNRGRADRARNDKEYIRTDNHFYDQNFNEIEDTSALDFYLS